LEINNSGMKVCICIVKK